MSEKVVQKLKTLLLLVSVLAAVKIIFVDYSMDEEYQIVMAYRNLSGDTLFGTMWEPHQTSAFLCVWLMWLFRLVTGGMTGVVLFLRVVTLGIQLLLTVWLTKVFRKFLERDQAFLLGCCYFNIVPKLIQIPDFSNLQLWGLTVTVLSLLQYYSLAKEVQKGKGPFLKIWLVSAGLGMSLAVLAYPASILSFPFFLAVIVYGSGKRGEQGNGWMARPALTDGAVFTGTCVLCAAVWVLVILSHVGLEEFLRNIGYIVDFDLTHNLSLGTEARITEVFRGGKIMLIHAAICAGMGSVFLWLTNFVLRRSRTKEAPGFSLPLWAAFLVLSGAAVELYYWVIVRSGYEAPQVHLLMLFLAAGLVWRQAGSRRHLLWVGILGGGVLMILAAIYMSDLGLYYSVAHGVLGAVFALALLVCALEQTLREKSRIVVYLLLFGMAFFAVFGKGYTLRAGRIRTVPEVSGLIKEGPAAGIFTSYIQAYITNCTYEDFGNVVKEGENCLIVTNMPATAGTSPYLFHNLSVSHFSIVDPTSYDERLLTYWACYPEKQPDVIVVDCWYGQLIEDPGSWIMQYIENDFGYTEMTEGRYVRFYRK